MTLKSLDSIWFSLFRAFFLDFYLLLLPFQVRQSQGSRRCREPRRKRAGPRSDEKQWLEDWVPLRVPLRVPTSPVWVFWVRLSESNWSPKIAAILERRNPEQIGTYDVCIHLPSFATPSHLLRDMSRLIKVMEASLSHQWSRKLASASWSCSCLCKILAGTRTSEYVEAFDVMPPGTPGSYHYLLNACTGSSFAISHFMLFNLLSFIIHIHIHVYMYIYACVWVGV